MSGLLWALFGVPLAGGALLAGAGRRVDRVAPAVGTVLVAAGAGLAIWAALTRPAVDAPWMGPLRASFAVDGLSAVLVVTVAAVALAVVVFATADIARDEARARFFGLLSVFVGAMLATVTATSLGTLLVAWEVMSATSWALIGFWWADPARPPAANKAFLVTRAGDLGLYLAAAAAFAAAGTLQLDALEGLPAPWLHAVAAGLVVAAAGKSAQLPFSSWLSAAMQGPSPVSALLHSATLVAAGAYLVLRTYPVLEAAGWALPVVGWLGAATALLLGLVAVAQRDLKQLLAASTCAQMGLVFLAVGVGGIAAGTAHLVAHAAFKSLLFLGAGVFLHTLGTRDLAELAGGGRRLPAVGGAFALGGLALAGVPPLSGWVTKDEILSAALGAAPGLWVVGVVAGGVSALYAGKALAVLLGRPDLPRKRVPARMVASMVMLAAAAVGLVVVGLPGPREVLERLVGGPTGAAPAGWELALSAALAVAGLAGMWALGRAGRLVPLDLPGVPAVTGAGFGRWLNLDRAGRVVVVGPTLALARALASADERAIDAGVRIATRLAKLSARGLSTGDRRLVDAAVEWLSAATAGSAAASRETDDRLVDRAVEALATALGAAGRQARRLQTGMVHQYYAQAVAALGLAAAALLLTGALT